MVKKMEEALLSVPQRLKTLEQSDTVSLAHTLITAPSAGAMTRLLQAALKTAMSRRGSKSSGEKNGQSFLGTLVDGLVCETSF